MATFIVHTTYNCNANCLHCGVKHLNYGSQVMDFLAGINAVKQCLNFCDTGNSDITLIFHGGEPFLPGVRYYEEFLQRLYREIPDRKITVSFQSNLTLYNKEWSRFLKTHNARVGTSYDFYTDFRRFNGDKNDRYFDVWVDKVKQYQDDFGEDMFVITVMSKINKNHVEGIIQKGKELGLRLKLNPLYCAGNAEKIYDATGLTPEEYGEILVEAYDAGKKYGVFVEQCHEMEEFISGKSDVLYTKCPYAGNCVGRIWGIAPDGGIFNCGDDIQLGGKYYMGNYQNGIDVKKYTKAKKDDTLVSNECLSCGICGGGCKLFRQNGKIVWCKSYKTLFFYIKQKIKFL